MYLLSYAERVIVNHDSEVFVAQGGFEGESEIASL